MEISGANLILSAGELSATYKTPIRDVGFVASFAIKIESVVSIAQSLWFDTDGTRRFNTTATLRFTGTEVAGAVTFRIRTSEDNITWTAWGAYRTGDYYCRYFQIEMTLTRQSLGMTVLCSQLTYFVDLPDVNEKGEDSVSVALSGKAVAFAKTFHQEPVVNIAITSGTGVYYRFSAKDTTGFTVLLYDAAGTAVVGDFEFHAYGT